MATPRPPRAGETHLLAAQHRIVACGNSPPCVVQGAGGAGPGHAQAGAGARRQAAAAPRRRRSLLQKYSLGRATLTAARDRSGQALRSLRANPVKTVGDNFRTLTVGAGAAPSAFAARARHGVCRESGNCPPAFLQRSLHGAPQAAPRAGTED